MTASSSHGPEPAPRRRSAPLGARGDVEDQVADRHADAGRIAAPAPREHAERQVLDREVACLVRSRKPPSSPRRDGACGRSWWSCREIAGRASQVRGSQPRASRSESGSTNEHEPNDRARPPLAPAISAAVMTRPRHRIAAASTLNDDASLLLEQAEYGGRGRGCLRRFLRLRGDPGRGRRQEHVEEAVHDGARAVVGSTSGAARP